MPPWQQEPPPAGADVVNENIARDDAYVAQQIGINYGTTIHRYETYLGTPADSPQRRLDVAVRNLEGGIPREAERRLARLLSDGHESTKLAYYYALSLFSDRSLNEMDEVYQGFQRARRAAVLSTDDGWQVAFRVISELVSCVWKQERGETLDRDALGVAQRNFRALPAARQEEIGRHLDLILGGAVQDSLDAVAAGRVTEERTGGDRSERAWKFFEADPAKPRQVDPEPTAIAVETWVRAVLGGVALILGLLAPFSPLGTGKVGVGIPALLVFVAGASCAFWFGLQLDVQAARLERREREHGIPFRVQPAVSPGHWVKTAFVAEVHRRVEERFRDARPHVKGRWRRDTRGIREYFKGHFVSLYGNSQVEAGQLDWLIRWHAERVARQWQAGTLFAYREDLRPSRNTVTLFRLSIAVAVAGALVMVGALGGFAATAILLGVGALPAARVVTAVIATRRCDREDVALNRQLAEEEKRAHVERLRILGDRPTDADVARWLNLDKAFLKSEALQRCGLTNRDLITHAVLTEGRSAEQRVRFVGGPWRYPSYLVLVFLLTRSGVREVGFELDFLTGSVGDERRRAFRYDALASARVSENGVRRTGGDGADGDRVVHSRRFQLSLLSGEEISVRAEGFGAPADSAVASESERLQTELVSSGIAGALHLLETVTAEGRDWINREQERRRRRSEEWQEGRHDLTSTELPDPFAWLPTP